MDPITNALAGFALARAGLNRLTPHGIWMAMLGAVVPIPFLWTAPLLALAIVAFVRFIARSPVNWLGGWCVAMIAIGVHLLLDATTHIDWVAPGDPFIAILLLLAVIAPFLSRMVSSEIGAQRSTGRGAAIFSLILVCLYIGARQQLHTQAETILKARVYDHQSPRRVAAVPQPYNPFEWKGLIETEKFLRVLPVPILGVFDPDEGLPLFAAEPSPVLEVARQSDAFKKIEHQMTWPWWQVIPVDETTEVIVEDLRTGLTLKQTFDKSLREIVEKRSLRQPGS